MELIRADDVCGCGHFRAMHGTTGCLVPREVPARLSGSFCSCGRFESAELGAPGTVEEAAGW